MPHSLRSNEWDAYTRAVPRNLKRWYRYRHLHFITFSCYRRWPLLGTARRRDALLRILEQVRQRHRFPVLGYVVMPEHVHLLIGMPAEVDPSRVIKVLKQRSARLFLRRRRQAQAPLFGDAPLRHFWQKRFYDFNVYSDAKRVEKLRYMHRNPVKRGLVESPELWRWSSYRFYQFDERGPVTVTRFEDLPDLPIPQFPVK